jgi:hypothetical protein
MLFDPDERRPPEQPAKGLSVGPLQQHLRDVVERMGKPGGELAEVPTEAEDAGD